MTNLAVGQEEEFNDKLRYVTCRFSKLCINSGESDKRYFNVNLRNVLGHTCTIDDEWQNVPQRNDAEVAHSVPGKVSYTTKNAGVDFIHQMKQLQAPCTPQGCVWDKDLAVHHGRYTEGEHFQSEKDFSFSGSFGTGFSCEDLKTHKRFFMKQVTWKKFRQSELLIPIHLDHKNLTKLYGVIQRDDMVDILMEDAGNSLTCFVLSNSRLEEKIVLDLTKHGLAGLKELHQNNVIHHDIKPDNLCVCTNANRSFTLKVTDFGSARYVNQPIDPMTWTPTYLAPEACRRVLPRYSVNRDEQITEKVDVFALGLTVLFMFEKQHALHKMRQVYCKDLSTNKKEKQNFYLCYLANWTEPPHDLFPKECSVKVKHLLTGMLSGSQDRRFSAEVGLAFIESFEVNQKECQHTQNGRLVTHPIENHQDAGAMSAIHGGVIDLNKVKLQNKKRKNIKESEVLEGGTDVLAMAETGRQNPRMETSLKSRSVNPTIQALERATGAGLTAQNFTQRYQANILSRKPERWKHKAERRQHPYKKMKQPVFGDSTPHVSLLPGPAIPNSVSSHMIDGEMKPGMGDDISPCIRMQQSQLGKSALDNQ